MTYQITVVRREKNPNFEEEMKRFNERNGCGKMYPGDIRYEAPQQEVTKNVLMCELTEEEYIEVKKSVLSTFK